MGEKGASRDSGRSHPRFLFCFSHTCFYMPRQHLEMPRWNGLVDIMTFSRTSQLIDWIGLVGRFSEKGKAFFNILLDWKVFENLEFSNTLRTKTTRKTTTRQTLVPRSAHISPTCLPGPCTTYDSSQNCVAGGFGKDDFGEDGRWDNKGGACW